MVAVVDVLDEVQLDLLGQVGHVELCGGVGAAVGAAALRLLGGDGVGAHLDGGLDPLPELLRQGALRRRKVVDGVSCRGRKG